MKNVPITKKLVLSFFIVVVGSIIITSLMANHMIDRRFNNYLEGQLKARIEKLVSLVESAYDEKTGSVNLDKDKLNGYAEADGFYIKVQDSNEKVIYSSSKDYLVHKHMMNNMMGRQMMGKSSNLDSGSYVEEGHDLIKNNNKIGKITIGYLGSYNLTLQDIEFRKTLNEAFFHSVILSIIFGLIISLILSKQLTTPLIRINKVANEMKKGNFKIRSDVSTSTLEINELSQSMNYLAESLEKQEVLRKRLTSDMAHEIRTPLTILQNYIEGFMDGVWEPTVKRFESCYEEILRITKLVGKLQDIAKLEQANLSLSKSSFDLGHQIEKVVEVFKPLYAKKDLEIITDIDGDLNIFMDKDKVKQILYNLLSNAYRYSNDKGIVKIEAKKDSKDLVITVEDNGIGISKEELPYIFERFYRTDRSRNRETGGTGIGLTITKALVEAHGGRIEVESEVGTGTKFKIIFPKEAIEG